MIFKNIVRFIRENEHSGTKYDDLTDALETVVVLRKLFVEVCFVYEGKGEDCPLNLTLTRLNDDLACDDFFCESEFNTVLSFVKKALELDSRERLNVTSSIAGSLSLSKQH